MHISSGLVLGTYALSSAGITQILRWNLNSNASSPTTIRGIGTVEIQQLVFNRSQSILLQVY